MTKPLIQNVGIVMLTLFLLWRGIIPALTTIDTDFPNYYSASRLVLEQHDISNIYNDLWFQQQMKSYGFELQGKFSPFPPPTVFVMFPFAVFSPLSALRVWTFFNIIILAGVVLLLSKISGRNFRWNTLVVLSCGIGLSNNFRFGQFYLVLLFLTISGFYFSENIKSMNAGIMFGLGAAVKYFPFVFVPLFLVRKEFKLLFYFCLSIIIIYGLSIMAFGIEVHKHFLSAIFVNHLDGSLQLQDPFNATFQSWSSLFRRFFIFDPVLNPNPLVNSSLAFTSSRLIVELLVITLTVWGCLKAQNLEDKDRFRLQFSLLAIAGLLLLPASATYHFLLLVLPISLLLCYNGVKWATEQKLIAVCYTLIGFIPYKYFIRFDGNGFLTLLAYPRLFLVTIIFVAVFVYSLRNSHRKGSSAQELSPMIT